MKLKFKAKFWKTGNSKVVTLPKVLADNLDDSKEYDFEVSLE